jgi:hypothetical protein
MSFGRAWHASLSQTRGKPEIITARILLKLIPGINRNQPREMFIRMETTFRMPPMGYDPARVTIGVVYAARDAQPSSFPFLSLIDPFVSPTSDSNRSFGIVINADHCPANPRQCGSPLDDDSLFTIWRSQILKFRVCLSSSSPEGFVPSPQNPTPGTSSSESPINSHSPPCL